MMDELHTENSVRISRFLDEDGRITQMPKKYAPREAVLMYLATKFKPNRDCSEHEINDICDEWSTIGDYFLLRRELVEAKLLARERDGSRYRKTAEEK